MLARPSLHQDTDSMITSETEVCNLALSFLGARRINNIESDQTTEAKSCRLLFHLVRDTLLRLHQWSFATGRVALSRVALDPSSEWTAAWQLPGDFIRLIRIVGDSPANPVRGFALEGRQLLTRGGLPTRIVYVANSVPVAQWDPLFLDAMRLRLAAEIAQDVAQSPELAAGALAQFTRLALPAAQTADAREVLSGENMGPAAIASMSSLVQARFRSDGRPAYLPTLP
jgi:hypothetical protein